MAREWLVGTPCPDGWDSFPPQGDLYQLAEPLEPEWNYLFV